MSNKLIALVSGGIDSAVSAALALEAGHELVVLHFERHPLSCLRAQEKVKQIAALLAKRFGKKITFVVVPHSGALTSFVRECEHKMVCVLCRRMMLRIAEMVAHEHNAGALLTGESLGQVASQTLPNMSAESGATEMRVAMPLLGMDKLEIEKLAKHYGTYEISIQPGACCEVVPNKPATASTRARAEAEEAKVDVSGIAEQAFAGRKTIEIGPKN